MKRHAKYILFFILTIAAIIISGLTLLTSQFFKFYDSYLDEELEEVDHQTLLVEWSITPILKEQNFSKLKDFCKDLKDEDIAIFILDKNQKLLATSRPDINVTNVKFGKFGKELFKNYKLTLKNKMIAKEKNIIVNNSEYTIKIALLQENMIKMFLKNQRNIIFVFLISILIIFAISVYVIFYLKLPFDKLQQSAIDITNGNLNSSIYIIKKGMLSEHSKTISNMSEQLKEKIKNLEYLENCKNEMLSGLSHEVKTPITSLILACELLKPEISSKSKINGYLDIIKSNAQRLNNLILGIIDITNLEYKSMNKYEEFDNFLLEDCIYGAIEDSKILAEDLVINFNFEKSVPIRANFQALETAIMNILVNAIKYSKTDKIDITLKKADLRAIISIKDYGIGIPKEHLSKIFDKFYRVDKNRSRELGGSGLGLNIVKQIINLHNGTIEAKSEKGCEFIITLPVET